MKTLIALIAMTMPVNASGIDLLPLYETAPKVVKVSHHAPVKRHKKPAKRKGHSFRPAPVAPATPLASEAVTRCLAPVRVVGSQDVREGAAEDSAKKGWMEAVRWAHGESYQDIANVAPGTYQKRCSRSSIGEALGQFLHRCEITAVPCRPGMVEGTP